MNFIQKNFIRNRLKFLTVFCVAINIACAGARSPETNAPSANEPSAPIAVTLTIPENQAAQTVQAFESLLRTQGVASTMTTPILQPVTGTIAQLPALPAPLHLPRIAFDANAKNEDDSSFDNRITADEAEREALRRFVATNAALLGIEATTRISLAGITAQSDGTRQALYQQKPFLFPLRGGYGVIIINYANDGHITALSSTALPLPPTTSPQQASPLAAQLAANARNVLTAEQALARFNALMPQLAPEAASQVVVRELVVYPLPDVTANNNAPATLELRLAWEIAAGDNLYYLDAQDGDELFDNTSSSTVSFADFLYSLLTAKPA